MRLIQGSRPSSPGPYLLGPSQSKLAEPPNDGHETRSETHKQELKRVIKTIQAFRWTELEYEKLRIPISKGLYNCHKLDAFLEKTRLKSWFERGFLVVRIAGPIHESLTGYVNESVFRLQTELLTSEESKCIYTRSSKLILYGKIGGHGKKLQGEEKIPDTSILVEDPTTGVQLRTVVFEGGFSETHEDLNRDMKQCLLHSNGQVQLVILAKAEEDRRTLMDRRRTDGFKDRAAKFLNDFGNPLGKIIHESLLKRLSEQSTQQEDQATMGSQEGSQTMDQSCLPPNLVKIKREIEDEDWVGPITVDLEFWELKDSKPCRRGQSVVSSSSFTSPVVAGIADMLE